MKKWIPVILGIVGMVVLPAFLYKTYDDRSKASGGEVLTPPLTSPYTVHGTYYLTRVPDNLVDKTRGEVGIDVYADSGGGVVLNQDILLLYSGPRVYVVDVQAYGGWSEGYSSSEPNRLSVNLYSAKGRVIDNERVATVYINSNGYRGQSNFSFDCKFGYRTFSDSNMLVNINTNEKYDILDCSTLSSLILDYSNLPTSGVCKLDTDCVACGTNCVKASPGLICPMIYSDFTCACQAGSCVKVKNISPTPTPPTGCYYQDVVCIQSPCLPVIVCPSQPPTVGACKSCGSGLVAKKFGNANFPSSNACDNVVNTLDYSIWSGEYFKVDGSAGEARSVKSNTWNADFNCDGKVTLADYSIWAETIASQ